MRILLFLLLLIPLNAESSFSSYQTHILTQGYALGAPFDLGRTMMAILVQESSAGVSRAIGDGVNGFGRRSYGVMQIKLQTAVHMISIYPELDRGFEFEEEIIVELMTNPEWNMEVGLHYLKFLRSTGLTWRQMVLAYNRGLRGSRGVDENKDHYVRSVARLVEHHEIVQIAREIESQRYFNHHY